MTIYIMIYFSIKLEHASLWDENKYNHWKIHVDRYNLL